MYSIKLNWKETKFNLQDVEIWIKNHSDNTYIGNSADTQFTLWFSNEPSLSVKQDIDAYWNNLKPGCPEAIRYLSKEVFDKKVNELKKNLLTKTWDQMSLSEKKLITNQPLTREDLDI